MNLDWKPSIRASSLNWGRHLALGTLRLIHAQSLESRFGEAKLVAAELHRLAYAIGSGDAQLGWRDLIAISEVNFPTAIDAATKWLSKGADYEDANVRVAGLIKELESNYRLAWPQAADQLLYRSGPLMQAWDGYGNGLLAHFCRLTGLPKFPRTCDVVLLQPLVNGDGFVSWKQSSIVLESVFVNPIAELPEVVRVAWLIAQLFISDPSENNLPRMHDVNAIALIPPILASGEIVELTRCDEATLKLAIEHFGLQLTTSSSSGIIMHWWETFLQTKPKWHIALVALRKSLS